MKRKCLSAGAGLLALIVLVVLDQLSKQWAVSNLKGQDPVIWIPQVFQLYYLENRGAAFGILQGQRSVFIVITLVVLILIAFLYVRLPYTAKYRALRVLLVFITAGAIGNFIDRAAQNYVVDFFYFNLIDFPVFNVADIYVTCATILLVLLVLFRYKDEDITEILDSLKGKKNTEIPKKQELE